MPVHYWSHGKAALGGLSTSRECKEKLIIFTRYPQAGETKTRLVPVLGEEGAAELHRRMTGKIVEEGKDLRSSRPISVEIRYDGGNESGMRDWLGLDYSYRLQGEGDLGERMFSAFDEAFAAGAGRVVLIGTDIPGLGREIMQRAFQALENSDLVLGPATDGGYYLIGLRSRPNRALFTDIPWGTQTVLESTLSVAREQGISTALVDLLNDVDRPEDLEFQASNRTKHADTDKANPQADISNRVSIIIPTLNEEAYLGACLSAVGTIPGVEIIIVDGGSTDKTVELAQSHGAKVLRSPAGRALQMNLGAIHATGEMLMFLHADTRLPRSWMNHVRRELNKPGTVAGAFELMIRGQLPGLRLIEKFANLRATKLQIPYGDQGIFIKADLFGRVGGFKDLPVMEDFELMRRLKTMGRISIAPAPALTSARRWEEHGILRTTAIHQLIIIAYMLGIPPKYLARLHPPNDDKVHSKKEIARRIYL